MLKRWRGAGLTVAVIGPLEILVLAAVWFGPPGMVTGAALCIALTFAFANIATSMLRRLIEQDRYSVALSLLQAYVQFLPLTGAILTVIALAPVVGLRQWRDITHTSRGPLFLLAGVVLGGGLYSAVLGIAGRRWRATIRHLEGARDVSDSDHWVPSHTPAKSESDTSNP